ncbi:hypothetical protein F4859DRAFT_512065 [Xylaria cf. heliscus]|nr:hypothetical protein F4859DRAFT_512065 [Xylaria cf. heliscus]
MGLQIITTVAYTLFLCILVPDALGQQLATVKCVTLAGGCDAGGAYASALQKAISQFYIDTTYGGGDGATIVYSAAQDGGALAQIAYSCKSGSRPPSIEGYDVRQRLQLIEDCENSCGSISVDSDCGFGVLIVEQGANPSQSCWSKGLQLLRSEFDAIRNLAESWLTLLENDSSSSSLNDVTNMRRLHIRASTDRDNIYSKVRRRTRTHLRNTQNGEEAFEMYALRGSQTAEEASPLLRNLEGAEEQLVARLGTVSAINLVEGTALVRGTAIGAITFTNILGAAGAFASALGFLAAAVGGGGGGDPDPGDGEGGGNDDGNGEGDGGNGGKLEVPPVCIPCANTIVTQVVAALRPIVDAETLDEGSDPTLTIRDILQAQSDNDGTSAPNLPGIGVISTLPGSGPYNGPSVKYYADVDTDHPFCIPHLTRSPTVRNKFWSVFDTGPPPPMPYATEHAFELHIVKDFVNWLTMDRGISCGTISDANLLGIPNSDVDFLDQVMRELSWYKSYASGLEYPCRERLSEFFVLESHLNQCKTKIMNNRPLGESEANNHILPRATSLNECDEYLDMYGMTADYLNAAPVARAFMYARKRVYNFLTKVHANPYISNINSNNVPVNELWVQFIDAWVIKRNNDFQAWRQETEQTSYGKVDLVWIT